MKLGTGVELTWASLSKRANSSLSILTSSWAVHWEDSLVNPSMSAKRILPEKIQTIVITLFIFNYALIPQSNLQNGVVISPTASCVLCHASSLLEVKYVITRALVEIRKNIVVCVPYSTWPDFVGYGTQKLYIFPYSTPACVITHNIIMVCGNTKCVSTCQVEFVLRELSFYILLFAE